MPEAAAEEPLRQTVPADEETGLQSGQQSNGDSLTCVDISKCLLALPFLATSLVGVIFFWVLWILLLPVKHCCQCGQGPCLEQLEAWLDKGAKLPLKLSKWATS